MVIKNGKALDDMVSTMAGVLYQVDQIDYLRIGSQLTHDWGEISFSYKNSKSSLSYRLSALPDSKGDINGFVIEQRSTQHKLDNKIKKYLNNKFSNAAYSHKKNSRSHYWTNIETDLISVKKEIQDIELKEKQMLQKLVNKTIKGLKGISEIYFHSDGIVETGRLSFEYPRNKNDNTQCFMELSPDKKSFKIYSWFSDAPVPKEVVNYVKNNFPKAKYNYETEDQEEREYIHTWTVLKKELNL